MPKKWQADKRKIKVPRNTEIFWKTMKISDKYGINLEKYIVISRYYGKSVKRGISEILECSIKYGKNI